MTAVPSFLGEIDLHLIAEGRHVTYDLKDDRDDPSAVGTRAMGRAIIDALETVAVDPADVDAFLMRHARYLLLDLPFRNRRPVTRKRGDIFAIGGLGPVGTLPGGASRVFDNGFPAFLQAAEKRPPVSRDRPGIFLIA